MNDVKFYHNQAMDLAEQAMLARLRGDFVSERKMLEDSFELESKAARACPITLEPTHSVLFRSAASLALKCHKFEEAERLVAAGLAGTPPCEIGEELRDLMEQIWFERHLELKGKQLDPLEIHLSLSGRAVGFGMAPSNEIISRTQALERLIRRTAERKMNLAYRENFHPESREQFEICLAAPMAASFAVTIRVGRPSEQPTLYEVKKENVVETSTILDEIVETLQMIQNRDFSGVERKITDEAYRRNFLGLARKLGPDDTNIRQVGLISRTKNVERRIRFVSPLTGERRPTAKGNSSKTISIIGQLKFADGLPGQTPTVIIVGEDGKQTRFSVPEGMMNDIVKPLWGERVEVDGSRSQKRNHLSDIRKIEE